MSFVYDIYTTQYIFWSSIYYSTWCYPNTHRNLTANPHQTLFLSKITPFSHRAPLSPPLTLAQPSHSNAVPSLSPFAPQASLLNHCPEKRRGKALVSLGLFRPLVVIFRTGLKVYHPGSPTASIQYLYPLFHGPLLPQKKTGREYDPCCRVQTDQETL